MLKVEILMNEEKVINEDIYDLDKMYQIIDDLFAEYNLPKIAKGTYVDNKNKDDFGAMWIIMFRLLKENWFISNAKKMLWYNSDGSDNEADYYIEDVLGLYKADLEKGEFKL